MRDLLHLTVAALVTALAALGFAGMRLPGSGPVATASLPVAGGSAVAVRVEDPSTVHVVTLVYGGRRASVVLEPARRQAVITVPVLEEDAILSAQAEPAGTVRLEPRPAGVARDMEWVPTALPTRLAEPAPRDARTGRATAAIDARDVWGVRPFGIPLRAEPWVRAEMVDTVFHGDVLGADCWVIGQSIGDGYERIRPDTYRSAVWFRVITWAGAHAFVPDTRYSRTADAGRLDLPWCAALPE